MSKDTLAVHLQRRDATRNMARFYRLSVASDLFGHVLLLREWGRIGTRGQRMIEVADDDAAARKRLALMARRKRQRGYVEVGA